MEQSVLDIYDRAAVLWQEVYEELTNKIADTKFIELFPTHNRDEDNEESDTLKGNDESPLILSVTTTGNSSSRGQILRYFWRAHQSFFKTLCMSLKLEAVVRIAKEALDEGKAVVIGLQSTGEASVDDAMEESSQGRDDLVATTELILKRMRKKLFPIPAVYDRYNAALAERVAFNKRVDALKLPGNPLDAVIYSLGGPGKVAELTGRKKRLVGKADSTFMYESRTLSNVEEKNLFMNDDKRVAIISDAASAGISLHSDRRFKNQRRRVHITFELAWGAGKYIQQLGRTNRANQIISPEYHLVVSPQRGEQRFASAVAARLATLGALTQGDRTVNALLHNIDNEIGSKSLRKLYGKIFSGIVIGTDHYSDEFCINARGWLKAIGITEADLPKASVSQFLNRILGLESTKQNSLYNHFMDIYYVLDNLSSNDPPSITITASQVRYDF